MIRRPPRSTLFPYTTLFRSRGPQGTLFGRNTPAGVVKFDSARPSQDADGYIRDGRAESRSEEHTSELQSQSNLVCRLLLEKKNKYMLLAALALALATFAPRP